MVLGPTTTIMPPSDRCRKQQEVICEVTQTHAHKVRHEVFNTGPLKAFYKLFDSGICERYTGRMLHLSVHVCVHACVHACVRVCVCVHACVCAYACLVMCACMCICRLV